ncbi:hypothetical protein BOTNAR_0083g00030 [Botryotinia narcissicola]|uniref:Uncharacterized protein n=1 Tax=Botryotinia narcissicola TaxID=278944 RepID=A0A4Z1J030_9HELO|nr:hypothetical protein BOTNAR_0083g00030 [Botryotinia narcissicola]
MPRSLNSKDLSEVKFGYVLTKLGSVCIQVFESKGGSCRCESSQNIYMVDVRNVLDRRNGRLKLSECSKDFTLTAKDSSRSDGRFEAKANRAVLKEKASEYLLDARFEWVVIENIGTIVTTKKFCLF